MTTDKTYDEWVAEINAAIEDYRADGLLDEVDEGEAWADMAASILLDAPREMAEEVCRTQIGFIPGALEDSWDRRSEPEIPRPQFHDGRWHTAWEVAAEHEGHEVLWVMAGAPGYGQVAYCKTCGRDVYNDIQILTEADVR